MEREIKVERACERYRRARPRARASKSISDKRVLTGVGSKAEPDPRR